ncbi:MAG: hypothetical protein NTV49_10630 [Kiritimatiellaeota bacterium]|nr:hypothetical protein [Kiritimatiellota bacterium]
MPRLEHHTALCLKILRDRVATQHVAKRGTSKADQPAAGPEPAAPLKTSLLSG